MKPIIGWKLSIILFLSIVFLPGHLLAQWHWQLCGYGTTSIPFLTADNGVLYACETFPILNDSANGIYMSTNEGDTWKHIGTPKIDSQVATLAVDMNRLLVGTFNGVWETTDQGHSWKFDGLDSMRVEDITMMGTCLVVAADSGIFLTTDNGKHWINRSIDFKSVYPTLSNYFGVSVLANGGGIIFAGTNEPAVWKSADSGKSWQSTGDMQIWGQPNLIGAITEMDGTVFTVISGTLHRARGIVRSTDSGNSWSFVNNGLKWINIWRVLAVKSNLFAGLTNGVFISKNKGDRWQRCGLNNKDIMSLVTDQKYLFAVDGNGQIWRLKLP
jgi:ligand-binding sensor domain-containing protein